jgi:hypothetical protein
MDPKDTAIEIEDVANKTSVPAIQYGEYIPDTEEEKRLVRKIDISLLPCIWLMYLLSYIDRTK